MLIAAGLGAQKQLPHSMTIPDVSGAVENVEQLLRIDLEESAVLEDLHPTLPLVGTHTRGALYLANGLDRTVRYTAQQVREAFVLAPVRPPTATADTPPEEFLQGVQDVAVTGGNVYVADSGNHRIAKLSAATMELVASYGVEGDGADPGELSGPNSVATDGEFLYILDVGNSRIVKVDIETLTEQATAGSEGSGDGELFNPLVLRTDGEFVYLTDRPAGGGRVQMFQCSDLAYHYTLAGLPDDYDLEGVALMNGWLYLTSTSPTRIIETDEGVGGFWRKPVKVVADSALPANTRTGNQLTADANGALPPIDGTGFSANDRILVAAESPAANNGVYRLVQNGSLSTPWILERVEDLDSDEEIVSGIRVYVEEGSTLGGSAWKLTTADPIAVNTTAQTWEQDDIELTEVGDSGSGEMEFSFPTGLAGYGGFLYVADSLNRRVVKLSVVPGGAPTWDAAVGSEGTGEGKFQTPLSVDGSGGVIYVADNLTGFVSGEKSGSIEKLDYETLESLGEWGPELVGGSAGSRTYAYLYEDEHGVVTARSPMAELAFGAELGATVEGFYSDDPKVTKVWVLASRLGLIDEVYILEKISNVPGGGTWSVEDDTADDDLDLLPYRTDKREGIHGLPPLCRTGAVWRDTHFMGGAVLAPDYRVGQATADADWSATRGLWRVAGTNTHWNRRMIGRYFAEESDEETKYLIVEVDEDTQELFLAEAFAGTMESAVDYVITDDRDPSYLFASVPGLHEDFPAEYIVPVGLGDGDEILAIVPRDQRLYVFKRNAIYAITGTSIDNFEVIKITENVGADSPRSVIEFPTTSGGTVLAFWSYPAVYAIAGLEEPRVLSTFVEPLLDRASEEAAARAVALLDTKEEVVHFSTGIDEDIANSETFAFEYLAGRWSHDAGVRMSAGGRLQNDAARRVALFLDEYGVLWQTGIGLADGVDAGHLTGPVESWDPQTLKVTSNAKSFDDDLSGAPIFLVRADGTFERNVVLASAEHELWLAWQPAQTPLSTWSFMLGGIERVFETGSMDQGLNDVEKRYEDLWLEHEKSDATVRVDARADEEPWGFIGEIDLSTEVSSSLPLSSTIVGTRGMSLAMRFTSLIPGAALALRGYSYRASWMSERT